MVFVFSSVCRICRNSLFGRAIHLTVVDLVNDVMRSHTVNSASNGLCGSQDFLHDSGQLLGLGPWPHDASGIDDIVHGDVAVVLDVLDLLTITWRFLQGLDDQGSGGGNDSDLSLTVLDGQLDGDLQTFPVLGGLGDVVTNLLGGQTEGTDLGSEGGGGGDFTSHGSQAHDLDFIGIELWFQFLVGFVHTFKNTAHSEMFFNDDLDT